ncbi:uncharacterized protein [Mytilus edulis]|uniref:Uncharacterized protein n=1 Tax=Mytilus galloprovincialis TaxID=29158 RepID=A0A8B6D5M5_MYTGA|nr:Hypothetical predicted protein [Mytilus galloprovincialis]
MTKRFNSRRVGNTTIKTLEKQPIKFAAAICPLNLEEQKERFLKFGKLPKFVLKGSEDEIENLFNKARNQIRFDLFGEAEYILKTVKEKYGDGDNYLAAQFGDKITKEEATQILEQYLRDNNLDGAMSIVWCADLASSARMMWIGPHCKHNRPEARNYSFWIKNSTDNNFLREQGIRCLADHEIGTHFFRSFNDGLQPWYSDRKRFDLRGRNCLEELRAEEGLAAINTILNAKTRFLWGPSLLYYTACKAAEMTFKQLYDHLTIYVKSPEHRWRLCMRVKRGLLDPNDLGGYGKDQCYFEGAVEILRSLDMIDFNVMMSGKICVDEVQRCKRIARLDCLKLPAFMKNENRYKKHLKAIAHLNGLDLHHQKKNAPAAYIRRLKQGRRIGTDKVRRIRRRRFKGVKTGSPTGSLSTDSAGSEYEDYCYGSSDSREGGGQVDYTPVEKLSQQPNTKDPRVDSGFVSHCSNPNDKADTISLKSFDSSSVKSFKSLKSEISVNSEISGKSKRSSDLSNISLRSQKSEAKSGTSVTSQKTFTSNSTVKLKSPVNKVIKNDLENISQKSTAQVSSNVSNNNNAWTTPRRKDMLPPLLSLTEEQKSWMSTTNGTLHLSKQPLPSAFNHNVCTTIISGEDSGEHSSNEKGDKRSRSARTMDDGDLRDIIKHKSEKSEVMLQKVLNDSHVVDFSSLTNSGVIRTKSLSANQNSVFHSPPEDSSQNGQNVMEYGPEKFIYPDLSTYFDSDFKTFESPFFQLTQNKSKSNTNLLAKRRTKSACSRRTNNIA